MKTIPLLFATLLFSCVSLFAQDEQYYIIDGNKTYVVTGSGSGYVADSEVKVDQSSWTNAIKVTINGVPYNADALYEAGVSIEEYDEQNHSQAGVQTVSVTKESLSAAVQGIYGLDGVSWMKAIDEATNALGGPLIELRFSDHVFDGPDRTVDGYVTYFDINVDDETTLEIAANDLATLVENEIANRRVFGDHVFAALVEIGEEQNISDFGARIAKLNERRAAGLRQVVKTTTTTMKAIASLPGLFNPGYSFVYACGELSEGELSAALDLFPITAVPVGKVWTFVKGSVANGEKIAEVPYAYGKIVANIAATEAGDAAKIRSFVSDSTVIAARNDQALALVCKYTFCFEEFTLVKTPNGLVPIRDMCVGKPVVSYNEVNGRFESANVLEVYTGKSNVFDITVADYRSGNDMVVSATYGHPFYTVTEAGGKWIRAEDLRIDDRLLTPLGPVSVKVVDYKHLRSAKVYNLRLDANYTYLVGDLNVVVHNKACAVQELEKYKASGNVLGLFDDIPASAIRAFFTKAGGGLDRSVGRRFANAIRRLRPGNHEWVPVNLLYNAVYKPGSKVSDALAQRLVRFMDNSRIPTGKLWFNNKVSKKTPGAPVGYNGAGQPLGHPGTSVYPDNSGLDFVPEWSSEFHNELNNAFIATLKRGNGTSFDPQYWYIQIDKILPNYFNGGVLQDVRQSLSAAVAAY